MLVGGGQQRFRDGKPVDVVEEEPVADLAGNDRQWPMVETLVGWPPTRKTQ
jgi:hypothetical protein